MSFWNIHKVEECVERVKVIHYYTQETHQYEGENEHASMHIESHLEIKFITYL